MGVVIRSRNLVLVEVQAGDMRNAGELGDLAGRAANTAANVKHTHSGTKRHAVGDVVLVTGDGAVKRLSVGEAAEVEALAPAVLVEVGSKVVVPNSDKLEASFGYFLLLLQI